MKILHLFALKSLNKLPQIQIREMKNGNEHTVTCSTSIEGKAKGWARGMLN